MRPYFEKMTPLGKSLTENQKESARENVAQIREVEKQVAQALEAVRNGGVGILTSNKGRRALGSSRPPTTMG